MSEPILARRHVVLLAVVLSTVPLMGTRVANAIIVNVNARVYGSGYPMYISLKAGTYDVTPIGVANGGAYDGWTAWGWFDIPCTDPNGCRRTSPTSVTGWLNSYQVYSNNFGSATVNGKPVDFSVYPTVYYVDTGLCYPSAVVALNHALPSTFTTKADGQVGFSIPDGQDALGDNSGGMSLLISARQNTLDISSTSGGSVTPSPGKYTYSSGEQVAICATPDGCDSFVNWTGTAVDKGKVADPTKPCTIVTMDGDYTLVANFKVKQHCLTITATQGGSVVAEPGGTVGPGETKTFCYNCGDTVKITSQHDPTHYFPGWPPGSGAGGSGGTTVTITMDSDKSVSAQFPPSNLHPGSSTGGSVSFPDGQPSAYNCTIPVHIIAKANSCYHFTHWSGTAVDAGKVANVNAADTTVLVDADYTLIANFEPDGDKTLTISSTAGGLVTSPSKQPFTYPCGTVVQIVATPDECHTFAGWTGTAVDAHKVADPNSASTTVTVDANYTLQANFAVIKYKLAVSSGGHGHVIKPGEGPFEYDCKSQVLIEAKADPSYCFWNWSGSAIDKGKVTDPRSANTTVLVDGAYDLKANFKACVALPQVKTIGVEDVTSVSARLIGTLVSDGNDACQWRFRYWQEGHEEQPTKWVPGAKVGESFKKLIESLAPQTTYYYVADANNSMGIGSGEILSFTTPPFVRLTLSSTASGRIIEPNVPVVELPAPADVNVVAEADRNCWFWCWLGTAVDGGKIPAADLTRPVTTVRVDANDTLRAAFLRWIPFWIDDVDRAGRRGARSSTSQLWDFADTATDVNGIPEGIYDIVGPAPNGQPPLIGTYLRCEDPNARGAQRWWPIDPCEPSGRRGLVASSGLHASINVWPSPAGTSVWLQVVWREYTGADPAILPPDMEPRPVLTNMEPFLNMVGGAQLDLQNGWHHTTYIWLVDPGTEKVNFTIGGPVLIDCLIVDTYTEGQGLLRKP